MSRSRRKTKKFGHCGSTEKQDKRLANRAFRRKTRVKLKTEEDPILPVDLDEVSDLWTMSKDGKFFWNDAPEKSMRK